MAKIIIARSGTNSLLKSAVSCSNFPVGGLRKEKRIQSWSLEIKNINQKPLHVAISFPSLYAELKRMQKLISVSLSSTSLTAQICLQCFNNQASEIYFFVN